MLFSSSDVIMKSRTELRESPCVPFKRIPYSIFDRSIFPCIFFLKKRKTFSASLRGRINGRFPIDVVRILKQFFLLFLCVRYI
jgi:hypothetical protein